MAQSGPLPGKKSGFDAFLAWSGGKLGGKASSWGVLYPGGSARRAQLAMYIVPSRTTHTTNKKSQY